MRILTKIKQLFCKHSFEKHYIPYGFRSVDGWLVPTFEYKCLKCGKTQLKITKQKGGATNEQQIHIQRKAERQAVADKLNGGNENGTD